MKLKKVMAFLMTAAMTLGMGAVAFASETTGPAVSENPVIIKAEVKPAKQGEKTTLDIVTTQDVIFGSYKFEINFDATKVTFDPTEEANQERLDEETGTVISPVKIFKGAYAPEANKVAFNGATTSDLQAKIKAGRTVASFTVTAVKDLEEGEVVAEITMPNGYTDLTPVTPVRTDADPVQVVVAKAPEPTTEVPTEPTTSGQDTTQGGQDATQGGNQGGNDSQGGNQGGNDSQGGNQTGTPAGTQAAPQKVTTKDGALNAITTLDQALKVGAKLDKSSFASDADYQAFVAAQKAAESVLNNPKATAEQKAKALADLKAAMSKATEKALVDAVNNTIVAPAATQATTKKVTNNKTGDNAPVVALVLVAIAAFGTAVVVYRKKVNA